MGGLEGRAGSRQQARELELVGSLFSSLGPALLVCQLDVLETLRHGGVRVMQGGVVAGRAGGAGWR